MPLCGSREDGWGPRKRPTLLHPPIGVGVQGRLLSPEWIPLQAPTDARVAAEGMAGPISGGESPGTIWAVIPARGGSKGVPGKNLSIVGGRSLIRRAIEACQRAATVSRVVVSTDDQRIAAAASACGAEVVRRPTEIAGDEATSESAVLHALESLTSDGIPLPIGVVLVQCTSPFTSPSDIDGVASLLTKFDCAFTAVRSHVFLWRRTGDGTATGVNHDQRVRRRRQDLEPEFAESGNAYAMRTAGFIKARHRFFGSTSVFEVDGSHWLEIDTPADLDRARALAKIESRRTPDRALLASIDAVIFDFDGVLTDNTVIVHQDGTESVTAHRGDGLGIAALQNAGIRVLILSKERNPVVAARAKKLAVEVIHGCDDKRPAALTWLSQLGTDPLRCAFVGNDVNDVDLMSVIGLAAAPRDAHPAALSAADWVLNSVGGRGAAREVSDAVLEARVDRAAHEPDGSHHDRNAK